MQVASGVLLATRYPSPCTLSIEELHAIMESGTVSKS